jgi:hypothetical protein
MADPISSGPLGNDPINSNEPEFVAQLGRISGKLLTANLTRNGVDLSFETDLLYLNVNSRRIGINKDNPAFDLDVENIHSTSAIITGQARIDNIAITAPNIIGTIVGPIDIFLNANNPVLFHDRLTTSALVFNDNRISSVDNQDIVFDPNSVGIIEIPTDVETTGNFDVVGDITLAGDLSKQGDLILGDNPIDVIIINTDFTQSLIPGDDDAYDLGKADRRWQSLHIPDWTEVGVFSPRTVTVSEQMLIDGNVNKISGIQSNEDIILDPGSGIVYIEQTKWQDNTLTNLLDTPLRLAGTGIGYTIIAGDNALLIPAGDISQRPAEPPTGMTRWNTELGYLELWNGEEWIVSTGGGEEVTEDVMEDITNEWALILG